MSDLHNEINKLTDSILKPFLLGEIKKINRIPAIQPGGKRTYILVKIPNVEKPITGTWDGISKEIVFFFDVPDQMKSVTEFEYLLQSKRIDYKLSDKNRKQQSNWDPINAKYYLEPGYVSINVESIYFDIKKSDKNNLDTIDEIKKISNKIKAKKYKDGNPNVIWFGGYPGKLNGSGQVIISFNIEAVENFLKEKNIPYIDRFEEGGILIVNEIFFDISSSEELDEIKKITKLPARLATSKDISKLKADEKCIILNVPSFTHGLLGMFKNGYYSFINTPSVVDFFNQHKIPFEVIERGIFVNSKFFELKDNLDEIKKISNRIPAKCYDEDPDIIWFNGYPGMLNTNNQVIIKYNIPAVKECLKQNNIPYSDEYEGIKLGVLIVDLIYFDITNLKELDEIKKISHRIDAYDEGLGIYVMDLDGYDYEGRYSSDREYVDFIFGENNDEHMYYNLIKYLKENNINYESSDVTSVIIVRVSSVYFNIIEEKEDVITQILNNPNVPDIYKNMAKEFPQGLINFIKQQAEGTDENGNPLEGGPQRDQVEKIFGKDIVDDILGQNLNEVKKINDPEISKCIQVSNYCKNIYNDIIEVLENNPRSFSIMDINTFKVNYNPEVDVKELLDLKDKNPRRYKYSIKSILNMEKSYKTLLKLSIKDYYKAKRQNKDYVDITIYKLKKVYEKYWNEEILNEIKKIGRKISAFLDGRTIRFGIPNYGGVYGYRFPNSKKGDVVLISINNNDQVGASEAFKTFLNKHNIPYTDNNENNMATTGKIDDFVIEYVYFNIEDHDDAGENSLDEYTKQLTESILLEANGKTRKQLVLEFVKYCVKDLGLKKPLPKIKLTGDKSETRTYGHFDPNSNTIVTYTKNRSLGDIMRTIAHELVHRKQDQDGKLDDKSGETGSPIENEANAYAGVLLRNFGQENPMIFEVKRINNDNYKNSFSSWGDAFLRNETWNEYLERTEDLKVDRPLFNQKLKEKINQKYQELLASGKINNKWESNSFSQARTLRHWNVNMDDLNNLDEIKKIGKKIPAKLDDNDIAWVEIEEGRTIGGILNGDSYQFSFVISSYEDEDIENMDCVNFQMLLHENKIKYNKNTTDNYVYIDVDTIYFDITEELDEIKKVNNVTPETTNLLANELNDSNKYIIEMAQWEIELWRVFEKEIGEELTIGAMEKHNLQDHMDILKIIPSGELVQLYLKLEDIKNGTYNFEYDDDLNEIKKISNRLIATPVDGKDRFYDVEGIDELWGIINDDKTSLVFLGRFKENIDDIVKFLTSKNIPFERDASKILAVDSIFFDFKDKPLNEVKKIKPQLPVNRQEFNELLSKIKEIFGERIKDIENPEYRSKYNDRPIYFQYGSLYNDSMSFSCFIENINEDDKNKILEVFQNFVDTHDSLNLENPWSYGVNIFPKIKYGEIQPKGTGIYYEANTRCSIYKRFISSGGHLEEIKKIADPKIKLSSLNVGDYIECLNSHGYKDKTRITKIEYHKRNSFENIGIEEADVACISTYNFNRDSIWIKLNKFTPEDNKQFDSIKVLKTNAEMKEWSSRIKHKWNELNLRPGNVVKIDIYDDKILCINNIKYSTFGDIAIVSFNVGYYREAGYEDDFYIYFDEPQNNVIDLDSIKKINKEDNE